MNNTEHKCAILDVMTSEWKTASEIGNLTNKNYYLIKRMLSEMVTDHQIEAQLFHKRTKYRRTAQIGSQNAPETLVNATTIAQS